MDGVAVAPIAYTRLAPLSIHGSSKRFRELVTYSERTPISSVARVRKSYNHSVRALRSDLLPFPLSRFITSTLLPALQPNNRTARHAFAPACVVRCVAPCFL